MDAALLHPELRRFARLPAIAPRTLRGARVRQRVLRLLPFPPLPKGVRRETVRLPGGAARVYTPAKPGGAALLWIHGGGMVIGHTWQDDRRCAEIARTLGIVVVSAEYRLAPTYPFPTPLDDVHAVWRWLLDHAAERGIDPRRLAIGGQSAGGGLAASLTLRVRDDGGVQPAAQWLFCPMLDDRTASDTTLDAARHFLWDNVSNRMGWTAYLAQPPGGASVPAEAVPARRHDLAGLPPTWIGYGSIELFRDEDAAYAGHLADAGVDVTTDEVPGAPHAFESIAASAPVTTAYLSRANAWLADRLDVTPS